MWSFICSDFSLPQQPKPCWTKIGCKFERAQLILSLPAVQQTGVLSGGGRDPTLTPQQLGWTGAPARPLRGGVTVMKSDGHWAGLHCLPVMCVCVTDVVAHNCFHKGTKIKTSYYVIK